MSNVVITGHNVAEAVEQLMDERQTRISEAYTRMRISEEFIKVIKSIPEGTSITKKHLELFETALSPITHVLWVIYEIDNLYNKNIIVSFDVGKGVIKETLCLTKGKDIYFSFDECYSINATIIHARPRQYVELEPEKPLEEVQQSLASLVANISRSLNQLTSSVLDYSKKNESMKYAIQLNPKSDKINLSNYLIK